MEKKIKNKTIFDIQNKNRFLTNLFNANAHYGCSKKLTHINSRPYLLGIREKNGIINLDQTIMNLKRCFLLINLLIQKKKTIVLVCNSNKYKFLQTSLSPYLVNTKIKLITSKWLPGYLTKLKKESRKQIGLIVLLNSDSNKITINESNRINIPIVSFLDTNENPNLITYPTVINTENVKTLFFLVYCLKKVIQISKQS